MKWRRGVAQLVEQWSPKPCVVGSSPATPAISITAVWGGFLMSNRYRIDFVIV